VFVVYLQVCSTDILHCRAVATFEATEAVASVVFRTVASVKTITLSSRILHLTATIAVTEAVVMVALCNRADHYIFILFLLSSFFFFFLA